MLVVYVFILYLLARKVRISGILILLMVAIGWTFGIVSYGLAATFNIVEAHFMNNRGTFHVLLVGPVQEEVAKFVCFFFAYVLIMPWVRLCGEGSSKIENSKSLVLLGAIVGLAFAVLENLIDYGNLAIGETFERTVMSWPLHMFTVGISAYGFYRYKSTSEIKMIVGFLLLAILIHFLFNLVFTFVTF
jgi:RsiW-degrading membrane proteinase PrsW (M82 family)